MPFEFVQPASRPFLTTPPVPGTAVPSGEPRRQLRADYQRWSRLLVGAIGVLLSLLGIIVAIGFPFSGARLTELDIAIAASGILPIGIGFWILIHLYRSGRALLTALSWWTAEPYRRGAATGSAAGWVQARTVNYEPPIFARLVTSSLLGLFGVLGICTLWYPTEPGMLDLRPAMIAAGIVCVLTSIGQMGGVMHLVSGMAEADPLWIRVRNVFRHD